MNKKKYKFALFILFSVTPKIATNKIKERARKIINASELLPYGTL